MQNIPTPCHIISLDLLKQNIERIKTFKQLSDCKILLAVKGFSAPYLFESMTEILDGISASGLYEAKLGKQCFTEGYIQTYSPAFRAEQIEDVVANSNSIIFNSYNQLNLYSSVARKNGCDIGIRINPLESEIEKDDVNPCRINSHLGIPIDQLSEDVWDYIDGIHIHCMCEQYVDALENLINLVTQKLGKHISKLKWVNLGGGQLIGKKEYDIGRAATLIRNFKNIYNVDVILEPCEGILSDCGFFATKVLDIMNNGMNIAVLDTSPICHMPDAVFRGWRRDVINETEVGYTYRLSGQTCFANDSFGNYTFNCPLNIGDIIYFKDTASYTWVKNNAFNGIPFPTICTYSIEQGLRIVKNYDYDVFYSIL